MTEKLRKRGIAFLKFAISAALIYFIFTKIDFGEVMRTLGASDLGFMVLALLCFVGSKILAALRLNLYFHQIGAPLSTLANLRLYLLGMFYNLFLPGGIGGDAYKGYVVQREFAPGTKKVISVLLVDRLSGMLLLFVYACALALASNEAFFQGFEIFLLLAIPAGILGFYLLNRGLSPSTTPILWKSLGLSALVQAAQLVCVLFILRALALEMDTVEYLLLFLVSSIVSVIPLTIGGIGSREVTFFYGAQWLGLDAGVSIGISFAFFLITALVSLFGIGYHFKRPRLESVG